MPEKLPGCRSGAYTEKHCLSGAASPGLSGLHRKGGETEVDFVAEKPDDKVYIQVTESMLSPETRERELRPLQMIPDNYEKIVLSMDRDFIKSYDGIKSLNLLDWLLDE